MSHIESADAARLDTAFRPGSVLAKRYQLVEKIGSGGMGSVWLAHDLSLDAPCAVKLVKDELVSNQEVRTRFAREAKLAAQLRSPHVVDVFDYGESNDTLFIVMAWLEGESLGARLEREGKLDAPTTYRIIGHVARALTSAHALEIVHRDLKPDNVYLVPEYDEETAKVLDFGIAYDNVYAIRDRATREGTLLGTPCYLSPEQACGKPVDHRSDLWALGVMAFECLTGHSPFDAGSIGEVIGRVLYEPLPLLTAFDPTLPPSADEWWRRAASRDPEKRFQSAKDLADEFAAALGLDRSVSVPPAGRARISSLPGLTRASGIYSPASRKRTSDPGPERPSDPAEDLPSPPSPAEGQSPSPAQASGPNSAQGGPGATAKPLPSAKKDEQPPPPAATDEQPPPPAATDEQPPPPATTDEQPLLPPGEQPPSPAPTNDQALAQLLVPEVDQTRGEPSPAEDRHPREAPAADQQNRTPLNDSDTKGSLAPSASARARRLPRWLAVGLPLLVVLAGLVGMLFQRSRAPEPPHATPQQQEGEVTTTPAVAAPKPAARKSDPTDTLPVIPLESLPMAPGDETSDGESSDGRPAVNKTKPAPVRRMPTAPAQPAPPTRDYGI